MKLRLLVMLFLLGMVKTYGQDPRVPETVDSLRVDQTLSLTFDDYYYLVLTNHPLVRQAYLLEDFAVEQLRLARGSFDPTLQFNWDVKDFKETEYFNLLDASLKIPVWFPLDPVVGFERNRGSFLNPENFISEGSNNQQIYAGVSLPIGRGLFIDERRALVKEAELFRDLNEAEQLSRVNKILLKAAKDYWDWYFAYQNYELMERSIDLAADIFRRTNLAFSYGEVAAIDTVQAKISLLNRQTDFQRAIQERDQAMLQMAIHLWDESGRPLELRENVKPVPGEELNVSPDLLESLLVLAQENHPDLRKLEAKAGQLEVQRRLAAENLKPRLNLNYYFLDQPLAPQGDWTGFGFESNYKFGVDFEFPLFLRKQRGKLNQTVLKQTENALQTDYKTWEIINQVNRQYVSAINTRELIRQQSDLVDNYRILLSAEQLNLTNGESDLFKINIQLNKLIESETKLLKERSRYQKTLATLFWEAGLSNLRLPVN